MLKRAVMGEIERMGRVENPKALKHQPVPQKPPVMNTILEIYPALTENDQGLSQSQSCALLFLTPM